MKSDRVNFSDLPWEADYNIEVLQLLKTERESDYLVKNWPSKSRIHILKQNSKKGGHRDQFHKEV